MKQQRQYLHSNLSRKRFVPSMRHLKRCLVRAVKNVVNYCKARDRKTSFEDVARYLASKEKYHFKTLMVGLNIIQHLDPGSMIPGLNIMIRMGMLYIDLGEDTMGSLCEYSNYGVEDKEESTKDRCRTMRIRDGAAITMVGENRWVITSYPPDHLL